MEGPLQGGYGQDGGPLQNLDVGSRVSEAIGGGGPDLGQSGGPLQGGQVGDRVQSLLGDGPSMGQDGSPSVPDEPGPAAAGRTPVVGSLRRANNMPVLRDNISN